MAFLSPKTAPGRCDLILELIFDMMDVESSPLDIVTSPLRDYPQYLPHPPAYCNNAHPRPK